MRPILTRNIITIPADPSDAARLSLMLEGEPSTAVSVEVKDGSFSFELQKSGVYRYQLQNSSGGLLRSGTVEVLDQIAPDLPYPAKLKTTAEETLEAIDAYLANQATMQQRSISINGKQIQYSSFSELIQWRDHFAAIVAKEKHGFSQPTAQIIHLKGV
jgi:hypothetical protein